MLPPILIALVAAGGSAAMANTPPERASTVIVYGDDPCPKSTEDEIVVCAREPETERYRIPKRFRDAPPEDAPAVQSWASRVEAMDQETRWTRPNSCSVVGSGGQTGCTAEMLHRWYLERKAMEAEAEDWSR